MGLFGLFSSSSGEDKRATEIRTGAVAPTRAERQKCWAARDAYFACLDANDIVDALKEDKKAVQCCGRESAGFEKDCAAQWVSSFFLSLLY
jgi:cytochrome c oxidase assembly factor 6